MDRSTGAAVDRASVSDVPAPPAKQPYEPPSIERLPDWQVITLVQSIPIR